MRIYIRVGIIFSEFKNFGLGAWANFYILLNFHTTTARLLQLRNPVCVHKSRKNKAYPNAHQSSYESAAIIKTLLHGGCIAVSSRRTVRKKVTKRDRIVMWRSWATLVMRLPYVCPRSIIGS